jgi:hypothetical protein
MRMRTRYGLSFAALCGALLLVAPNASRAAEGPYSGTPAAIPGTVQAENYDTGGQGVAYSVASTNGTANSYLSDGFHIANSSGTNLSGAVSVPNTGAWQTWTTVTARVTLPAGQQTLTIFQ